jgi:hypothetical protein
MQLSAFKGLAGLAAAALPWLAAATVQAETACCNQPCCAAPCCAEAQCCPNESQNLQQTAAMPCCGCCLTDPEASSPVAQSRATDRHDRQPTPCQRDAGSPGWPAAFHRLALSTAPPTALTPLPAGQQPPALHLLLLESTLLLN